MGVLLLSVTLCFSVEYGEYISPTPSEDNTIDTKLEIKSTELNEDNDTECDKVL
jgi:hypothetical protein